MVDKKRALLLCVLLAACQSGKTVPPPATAESGITPEYIASLPTGQSRPAVSQLANEVVASETERCNDNPDIDWSACVSTRMLVAFDRYGFLGSHCRDRPDYKALRDCVAFGRSGVDWVLATGGNPDTDFDWSQPRQSHDTALKNLNDHLTARCEGKAEQPGDSCFTRLSAQLLGLSDMVARYCAARQELEERGACIVDAHDAAMYQAALAILAR